MIMYILDAHEIHIFSSSIIVYTLSYIGIYIYIYIYIIQYIDNHSYCSSIVNQRYDVRLLVRIIISIIPIHPENIPCRTLPLGASVIYSG